MGVRRLRLRVAVATCALITMCGCTTSDGTKPSELPSVSNSGSASTSPTPKLTAEQEAIVGQYKAYFEESVTLAGAPENIVYDTLTQYAYPAVVKIAYTGLQSLVSNGQQFGGTISFGELNPTVFGNTAKLVECRDMTSETLISATDGSVISHGSPGARFTSEFDLNDDGRWRITLVTAKENVC